MIGHLEERARAYAVSAHGDQKYGDDPYVIHLAAVRTVLMEFGFAGNFLIAAWLHDVLEDCKVSRVEMERLFGFTIVSMVAAVTGQGDNRKARNKDVYTKLEFNPSFIPLKLADRIANLRACLAGNPKLFTMYEREYPEFKAALYELSDRAVCDPMWRELDRLVASFPTQQETAEVHDEVRDLPR